RHHTRCSSSPVRIRRAQIICKGCEAGTESTDVFSQGHDGSAFSRRCEIRIQERRYRIGESCNVSCTKLRGLEERRTRVGGQKFLPLIRSKEEHLTLLERATQGSAELVQTHRQSLAVCRIGNVVGKKWISVEGFVTYELPRAPVQLIAAGLGNQVRDCAGAAPDFRGVIQGQYLNF